MAFKFLRAKQKPPVAFADHEEPALPPPPAAAPAAPNPVSSCTSCGDVPAPAAEPEVIFVVTLSIPLCVG